jgi:hypothetical protein
MGRNYLDGSLQQSISVPTLVPIVESTNGLGGLMAFQASINCGSPTKPGSKPKATIDDITIILADLTIIGNNINPS